jgi:spermidine/putrescine-binding protein
MTFLGETKMSYPLFARCLSLWLVISLTACTGAAEPATEAQSACPQPTVKVELTATEVNLFTWPEYVPEEIIDCFQTVYGIEVNQDLFSSPEEMYAKVARGATGYDLIQPPDYAVDQTGVVGPARPCTIAGAGSLCPAISQPRL